MRLKLSKKNIQSEKNILDIKYEDLINDTDFYQQKIYEFLEKKRNIEASNVFLNILEVSKEDAEKQYDAEVKRINSLPDEHFHIPTKDEKRIIDVTVENAGFFDDNLYYHLCYKNLHKFLL